MTATTLDRIKARIPKSKKKPTYTKLPEPLGKPGAKVILFAKQRPIQVLLVLFLVYNFMSWYYLGTQTTEAIDSTWHRLVPDDTVRHYIRNVGQGFYANLIALFVLWNHYRSYGRIYWFDNLERWLNIPNPKFDDPVRWWQVPYALTVSLVYALTFAVLTGIVVQYIIHHPGAYPTLSAILTPDPSKANAPAWKKLSTGPVQDWDQKLIGFVAVYFGGRRPLRKLYDWYQTRAAARLASRTAPLRWWHKAALWMLPPFHARVNELREQGVDYYADNSWWSRFWQSSFRWLAIAFIIVSMLHGMYIQLYIAR